METTLRNISRGILSTALLFLLSYPSGAVADDTVLLFLPPILAAAENISGPGIPPGTIPPTIEDLNNLYKNYPLGSQPAWLTGEWTTGGENFDEKFTLNADGTCRFEKIFYNSHTQIALTCNWGVKNLNQLYFYFPQINDPAKVRAAQISPVSDTSFHFSGLYSGLKGYQYNKITANTDAARYPGHFFLGSWHTYDNITNDAIWEFYANGSLQLTIYSGSNAVLSSHSGSWSVTNSTISLNLPDSQYNGVYDLSSVQYSLFNTTSSLGPFSRRLTPRAPADDDPFIGQYHGFDTTMVVSYSNGGYHVDVVEDGTTYSYNASILQNINLVIYVDNKQVQYTLQNGGFEKANSGVTITPTFPNFLYKISVEPIPNPTSVVGRWEHFNQLGSSSYLFMPNGHYVSKIGSFKQVGQYFVANNTLKREPVCQASSQTPLNITENQLVEPLGNGLSTTYLFEPLSHFNAGIYERGFVMSRTIENNGWKNQIQLGAIKGHNPSLTVAVGNSGLVTVGRDLSPNDVFQNANVFKDVEDFWWHDYIVNNLNDSVFYFYPSGRFLYVSVSYGLIPETYYDVVPRYAGNVLYLWGKYRIDDTIEGNPRSAFDKKQLTLFDHTRVTLLNGHRQIHFPDTGLCWENYKWLSK